MIRITSKKPNFRRAGIAHSVAPTDYPDDFFDGAQLRALREEPMLVVEKLPDPKPKGARQVVASGDPGPSGAGQSLAPALVSATPAPSEGGAGAVSGAAETAE
ncbi:MAG: HI1506-related protein [Candidatus Competibacter sp.]|jgi:hypothetical protein